MSEEDSKQAAGSDAPQPETPPAARPHPRRRPLRDPFGDVLPDITGDEREPGSGGRDDEAWYRDNRPPHHDRY